MDFAIKSSLDEENSRWNVSISGEIDIFNSADLKKSLTEIINEKNVDLHIDCSLLEYMDSTALGALVGVLKNVKSYNGDIHLINVKPNIGKLFKITNLDKVFVIGGGANGR